MGLEKRRKISNNKVKKYIKKKKLWTDSFTGKMNSLKLTSFPTFCFVAQLVISWRLFYYADLFIQLLFMYLWLQGPQGQNICHQMESPKPRTSCDSWHEAYQVLDTDRRRFHCQARNIRQRRESRDYDVCHLWKESWFGVLWWSQWKSVHMAGKCSAKLGPGPRRTCVCYASARKGNNEALWTESVAIYSYPSNFENSLIGWCKY